MHNHKRATSSFPRNKFKLMAGSQMLLGMACVVLGGVDMALSRYLMNLCYGSRENQHEQYEYTIARCLRQT